MSGSPAGRGGSRRLVARSGGSRSRPEHWELLEPPATTPSPGPDEAAGTGDRRGAALAAAPDAPPSGRTPAGTGSAESRVTGAADENATPPASNLRRATMGMAAGTAVSRVTGLLRVIALAYALGSHFLADSYNLANTTPNMVYDIVLGGVLSATFIPVFVDRLATRSEREAWRAISAILSVSAVVLVVMTVVSWLLAPEIVSAFTVFGSGGAHHDLAAEKEVATTLLRWFVPQIALYGMLALATALLNTRRRFAAPMWVPIANNVVCIGVLLWFSTLTRTPTLASVHAHPGQLVLLGLGTTAGVALQASLLLPHLRGIGLGRLRWRWDPGHEAVRTVVRLGAWTFGFVLANQAALYVVLALAVGAPGTDPVSSYTYAYTFMLLPFAIVAVSVMSAVTPELSERWAVGDVDAFRRRLAGGLRATLAVILPAAVGMFVLARPAAALLLAHGRTSVQGSELTGAALALFSLGLPGFCAFLYVVRVLQSMQRTRTAFWLYLVENGINVVLAVALVHSMGVRGLALSLSIAYTVGAVCGLAVLHRWLGTLGGARTWAPLRRVVAASAVMGVVVLVVSNLSGAEQGVALLARVGGSVVVGGAVYAGAAFLLGGQRRDLALWPAGAEGDRTEPGPGPAPGAPHEPVGLAPRATSPRAHGERPWSLPAPQPGSGRHVARDRDVLVGGRRHDAPPVDTRPPREGGPPSPPPGSAAEEVPSFPRLPPGSRIRIVPAPSTVSRRDAPVDFDQLDVDGGDVGNGGDVGKVRWIGGTETPLHRRRPR